ncbi:hypothetical protein HYX13_00270 [Candidatus Woesearchaeota archaeon]|nr:hypothetical protein [Candidatus Woesearchaeota archaeon]
MFSLFSWQHKIHKISPRNLILAFLGKIIFLFGFGAWFAEELDSYRIILLFLGTVGILHYLLNNLLEWKMRKEINYKSHFLGVFSGVLLVLALAVEFAQLKSGWLFVVGVLFIVPALREGSRGKT